MARDPSYPLIPVIDFIGVFLVLIPFSTRALRKWNTGVCMFAFYVTVMCLFRAIDTIVWANNYNIMVPVWCDIESHFDTASLVGIPACSLVISRRLCKIIKSRSLVMDKTSRRNEILVDLGIAVGFPTVYAVLYYIVQGARFEVAEGFGCGPAVFESGITFIVLTMWPVIIPAISALFYSPRILWFFYRYRREVDAFLISNQSIKRTEYFRVMTLGCVDAVPMLPIGIYNLVLTAVQSQHKPFWPGWTPIHTEWGAFAIPINDWNGNATGILQVRFDEVIDFILAAVFFLIFGLTKEARANYWSAIKFVLKPLVTIPRSKDGNLSTISFETRRPSVAILSETTANLSDADKGNTARNSLSINPSDGDEVHKEVDPHMPSGESEA